MYPGRFVGGLTMRACIALILLMWLVVAHASPLPSCAAYQRDLTRIARAQFGINAPVPMLAAQLQQESSCRANVTAWDKGRGLAQFMDGTAADISRIYPSLGRPDPYNPAWSMRAQSLYMGWLLARVKGEDDCQRWAAALVAYNGGLGYVQAAQRASAVPGQWFGVTEKIPTRQSAANFAYSRSYPRKVLFKHQPRYAAWGAVTCAGSAQ